MDADSCDDDNCNFNVLNINKKVYPNYAKSRSGMPFCA